MKVYKLKCSNCNTVTEDRLMNHGYGNMRKEKFNQANYAIYQECENCGKHDKHTVKQIGG